MRSLRARKKVKPARSGRTKSRARKTQVRFDARGAVFGRRKKLKNGPLARFFRRLHNLPMVGRPMLALTLVLVAAGAGAGLIAGGQISTVLVGTREVLNAAGFAVGNITITGNERTSADAVHAALGFAEGDSIFTVDPQEVRTRLMELPWAADVVVRRSYPGSVAITLIEKRPFALWHDGTNILVVERSGAVILGQQPQSFAHLPVLLGEGAPQMAAPLIDALSEQRAVSARLRAAERVAERRWNLLLVGAVTVRLPEEGWENELAELERLIVDRGVLERDIEMIDLRYPDNYIFRLHNGDSRPVSRERPA